MRSLNLDRIRVLTHSSIRIEAEAASPEVSPSSEVSFSRGVSISSGRPMMAITSFTSWRVITCMPNPSRSLKSSAMRLSMSFRISCPPSSWAKCSLSDCR